MNATYQTTAHVPKSRPVNQPGRILRNYRKWTLTSPLWLPLFLTPFGFAFDQLERYFGAWNAHDLLFIGFMLVYSLLFGGVQYLITLFLVWRRIDFDDGRSWLRTVLIIPLIFTPIQIAATLPFILNAGRLDELHQTMLYLAILDLGFGYSYVALWLLGLIPLHLVTRFLKKQNND
ncbi:MAG: hypothetical protein AAF065_13595 [Verrucomicrobiota bacterium]